MAKLKDDKPERCMENNGTHNTTTKKTDRRIVLFVPRLHWPRDYHLRNTRSDRYRQSAPETTIADAYIRRAINDN